MRSRALVMGLLVLGGVGCKPMLYPLARAFGSPSEGELKLRRAAFTRLKTTYATAQVRLYPVVDPMRPDHRFAQGLPDRGADMLRNHGWAGAQGVPARPEVAPLPLGHNQLRYQQTRAKAYSDWARTTKPAGDFLIIVEVLSGPDGKVGGIHAYVLEASGQVAYTRLWNSHHFGPQPPANGAEAFRLALRRLHEDLQLTPEQVHPPYGVG